MKITNSIKNFFRRLSFKIRSFFYFKYFGIYEIITLKLLATVTPMVRKLLVFKGKDPDYVPPPPPPPAPIVKEEEIVKPRPNINIPYVPEWVRKSFGNISEHVVFKSRMNLNLKPNPDPYDLVSSKLPEPVKEPEIILSPTIVIDEEPSGDELLSLLEPQPEDKLH